MALALAKSILDRNLESERRSRCLRLGARRRQSATRRRTSRCGGRVSRRRHRPDIRVTDALDRLFKPRSVAVLGRFLGSPASSPAGPVAYLAAPRLCRRDLSDQSALPGTRRADLLSGGARASRAAGCRTCPARIGSGRRSSARTGAGRHVRRDRAGQRVWRNRRRRSNGANRSSKHAAGAMRLLGPNTIGLVNVTDRIMLIGQRRHGA